MYMYYLIGEGAPQTLVHVVWFYFIYFLYKYWNNNILDVKAYQIRKISHKEREKKYKFVYIFSPPFLTFFYILQYEFKSVLWNL